MGIDVYIDDGVPNPEEAGSGKISSTETCLFCRCARKLLNEGNPSPEVVIIRVPGTDGGLYPMLAMSMTRAGRLVCWPALPERLCAPEQDDKLHLVDHVTLELATRRSHSSAYGKVGGKLPTAKKWKLHSFPANGVSFWFGFAISLASIESQTLEWHQWIRFPTPDVERRKAEYVRFFEKLQFADVEFRAENQVQGNTLLGLIYIVDNNDVTLSNELLEPVAQLPHEFCEAPIDPKSCEFMSKGFSVNSTQLGLLVGVLPWRLSKDGPILATPRTA